MIFNRVGSLLLHALAHIPAIQISALMWWNWSSWYKLLGSTPWICRHAACLKFAPLVTCPAPSTDNTSNYMFCWYCKINYGFASGDQGTPLGLFGEPDVLGAVLDLIKAALLWSLEKPVFIGLTRTSLCDQQGQRILTFFKTLPDCSPGRNIPRVHLEMYEVMAPQLTPLKM